MTDAVCVSSAGFELGADSVHMSATRTAIAIFVLVAPLSGLGCGRSTDGRHLECLKKSDADCMKDRHCVLQNADRLDTSRNCMVKGKSGCVPANAGCSPISYGALDPKGTCWLVLNYCGDPEGWTADRPCEDRIDAVQAGPTNGGLCQ